MTTTYTSFTETGLKRKTNQDRITVHMGKDISLFAVADGMGGHSEGEFASEAVIKYLDRLWNEILGSLSSFENRLQYAVDMIIKALEEANEEIFRYAEENNIICGTTVSAVLIIGKYFAVINVGDSPVYRADRKRAVCEHTDHSFGGIAMRSGCDLREIDENRRRKLVQAVGVKERLMPSVRTGCMTGRQMFLICSDGVGNYFKEREIFRYLKKAAAGRMGQDKLSETLKNRVYSRGAEDNLSAIIVCCRPPDREKTDCRRCLALAVAIMIFFIFWAAVNWIIYLN